MSDAAQLDVIVATAPRQFRTVKGALLWYRNERARRHVLGRDAGGVRVCRSRTEMEQANLAFGLISACLVPETGDDAVLGEAALRHLLEWFCADRSLTYIADELGLSEHVTSKWMGRLEWAMNKRMRGHRLLLERSDEVW